jgi:hypothetical protein
MVRIMRLVLTGDQRTSRQDTAMGPTITGGGIVIGMRGLDAGAIGKRNSWEN